MARPSLRVRPATADDLPALVALGDELRDPARARRRRGRGRATARRPARPLEARYAEALADPDRHLVVVVDDGDGRAARHGAAHASRRPTRCSTSPAVHMSHAVVADRHRRRGAGRALVRGRDGVRRGARRRAARRLGAPRLAGGQPLLRPAGLRAAGRAPGRAVAAVRRRLRAGDPAGPSTSCARGAGARRGGRGTRRAGRWAGAGRRTPADRGAASRPPRLRPVAAAKTAVPRRPPRPRLLLLDGHSLAYRAFFALPVENFSTTDGQPTNAVYGFTAMLINVLRDEQPDPPRGGLRRAARRRSGTRPTPTTRPAAPRRRPTSGARSAWSRRCSTRCGCRSVSARASRPTTSSPPSPRRRPPTAWTSSS